MQKKIFRDILQWDVASWSVALKFWDKHLAAAPPVLKVLELGGREGGLSLWIAMKGHEVICSDLDNAGEKALPLHPQYPHVKGITYRNINALEIPFEDHFDIIIFKSILGGIGDEAVQQKVIRRIHHALKKGGRLFFAENLRGTLMHRTFRKLFAPWHHRWYYPTLPDMQTNLSLFSHTEIRTTGVTAVLGRSETQRNVLAFADKILRPVVPRRWNYIVYGIAVK